MASREYTSAGGTFSGMEAGEDTSDFSDVEKQAVRTKRTRMNEDEPLLGPNMFNCVFEFRGADRKYYSALLNECQEPSGFALHEATDSFMRCVVGSHFSPFEIVFRSTLKGEIFMNIVFLCSYDTQRNIQLNTNRRFDLLRHGSAHLDAGEVGDMQRLSGIFKGAPNSSDPISTMDLPTENVNAKSKYGPQVSEEYKELESYENDGYHILTQCITAHGGQHTRLSYRPLQVEKEAKGGVRFEAVSQILMFYLSIAFDRWPLVDWQRMLPHTLIEEIKSGPFASIYDDYLVYHNVEDQNHDEDEDEDTDVENDALADAERNPAKKLKLDPVTDPVPRIKTEVAGEA